MILVRHAISSLITIAGIAAALSASADEPRIRQRYEEAASVYRNADTVGKQRFIEDLLARSDAAASVTNSGANLRRIRERNRAILGRVAQGRELTEGGLLELLAEVDAQEQQAIAKLRRDFAYSTAQAFHDDRAEFDKWHDAWDRIERRYQQDGRPLAWQRRMIDWLALASARQAQVSIARLQPYERTPGAPRHAIPPRRGPNIQQSELEARIAGYNLAAARLLSELHAQKSWTVAELARSAGELADLSTTRHDLGLYWQLVPGDAQSRLTPLRALDDVISLLARRTAELRRDLERTAGDSPRAAWELRRLDEVSRRLATLATPRG